MKDCHTRPLCSKGCRPFTLLRWRMIASRHALPALTKACNLYLSYSQTPASLCLSKKFSADSDRRDHRSVASMFGGQLKMSQRSMTKLQVALSYPRFL